MLIAGGKARCDKLAGGPSGRLRLLELEAQRAVGVKGDGGIAVVDVSAAGARLISFQKGGRLLYAKGMLEGRCRVSLSKASWCTSFTSSLAELQILNKSLCACRS